MAYPLTKRYANDLSDFHDLLRAVADWKKLPAAIIEKDYYLTRALFVLSVTHDGQFILKGGTSLSKGWHLLDRFSEDLDILVRSEPGWGKAKRDTRLKAMRDTIGKTPGFALDSEHERARAETGVSRTCVFAYTRVAADLSGVGKSILLEAGYRGCPDAAVKKQIQSYVTEYATETNHSDLAEDLHPFHIELQDVKRTFVEKLFAIHGAYSENRCANQTRHYYDVFKLCGLSEIRECAGTEKYRECVKDVKQICERMFPKQAVPQTESFSESPAFKPDATGLKELEGNYKLEADLFFGSQPPLSDVLRIIGELLPKL